MGLALQPLRCNVELKCRLDRLEDAVAACAGMGAEDRGAEVQTDTYFSTGKYRLKLREVEGGPSLLIGYSRPDAAEARRCQYRTQTVGNPGALKAALGRLWGVKVVVRKSRRLFLWRGFVRIHLDRVEGLGDFLEFEAVVGGADGAGEAEALAETARLRARLGITERDLVAESYASLVLRSGGAPSGT